MKILLVAMSDSIHSVRWSRQLAGLGWDVRLFPAYPAPPSADFRDILIYDGLSFRRPQGMDASVRLRGWLPFRPHPISYMALERLNRSKPFWPRLLARAIRKFRPAIVHSMELQHAGYLTLAARDLISGPFPKWLISNWGSDIFLFGRLKEHQERIRRLLSLCDSYHCECHRDVQLAKDYGLEPAKAIEPFPNTGGFDMQALAALGAPAPPSSRRVILIKGYQHWAGRALTALQALRRCADLLKGFEIAIYCASPEVQIAAELLEQDLRIPVNVLGRVSHDEILRWHGKARVYIGLSISDAISTSLLEAMAMGAFPIQSCTACADEWLLNGRDGFIVPPEDPEVIAQAFRQALTDNALVDQAARNNRQTIRERLDAAAIRGQVIAMYQRIAQSDRIPARNEREIN